MILFFLSFVYNRFRFVTVFLKFVNATPKSCYTFWRGVSQADDRVCGWLTTMKR